MSTYSSTLKLNDQFSKPLQSIVKAMHMTLNVMEQLNSASARDIRLSNTIASARAEVTSANRAIQRMTQSINDTNNGINHTTEAQRRYNNEAQKSTGIFSNLKNIVSGLIGLYAIKKSMETLDNLSNISARLNLINDGSQTLAQLQDKIYRAAQDSRGEYALMASSVGKLGILAKDAFKTNDEAIYFVEQMNKQFKIGGASIQEQSSAMYQLTQAMAAGKLQGDEFRSIMENAPLLARAIAMEMKVPMGDLKKMGSEGKITAQIIKNAMINSAKETDAQFKKIPMTFGDIGNLIKNKFMVGLIPIQQSITNLFNSSGGMAFVNALASSLNVVVMILSGLLNSLIAIGTFVQQNWNIIQPILIGIGAAFLLWGATQIPMLITKLWLMVTPILAQAAAWLAVNWPILLIGAAIGLLLFAMIKFGNIVVKVVGVVGGIFGSLFAFLFNNFAYFANIVLSVAEFFINVWRDPIYAVKKLFFDLAINALSFLTNIAKGIEGIINKIPGLNVNMTGGMTGLLEKLKTERDNLKSDKDVVKLTRFNQISYGDAFNKGQQIGEKVGQFAVDGVQNIAGMIGDKFNSLLDSQDNLFGKGNSQIGSIKSDVKINAEDIKLLRDVAEREAINKISTLAPNITVKFGDVRETADVNVVANRIKEMLEQQIALSAEGAYR
ncbi:tape measure protein [Pseudobacteroides cellulosolvens]|uniref:tape measure protein n=1 Tax=Pseudobacteroides cellulosolvens TaxID=35825 RepID=UPI00068F32EA|nr:tape measure protein [Pseudobacteroides cellulosolvens]